MKLLLPNRKPSPVRVGSVLILYALIAVFLAGCAMLVAAALGAQDRAIKPGPVRVQQISIVPHREMGGRFTSFAVTAVVQFVEYLPSGEVQVKESRIVSYDMMAGAPETVDVSGHSRRYSDIAASMYASAIQEAMQSQVAEPVPLPGVDRRALRAEK